jgi:hypothetical protein
MHVCVVKTGHHEMAIEINDLRFRSFELQHIGSRTYRDYFVSRHGERLGALA